MNNPLINALKSIETSNTRISETVMDNLIKMIADYKIEELKSIPFFSIDNQYNKRITINTSVTWTSYPTLQISPIRNNAGGGGYKGIQLTLFTSHRDKITRRATIKNMSRLGKILPEIKTMMLTTIKAKVLERNEELVELQNSRNKMRLMGFEPLNINAESKAGMVLIGDKVCNIELDRYNSDVTGSINYIKIPFKIDDMAKLKEFVSKNKPNGTIRQIAYGHNLEKYKGKKEIRFWCPVCIEFKNQSDGFVWENYDNNRMECGHDINLNNCVINIPETTTVDDSDIVKPELVKKRLITVSFFEEDMADINKLRTLFGLPADISMNSDGMFLDGYTNKLLPFQSFSEKDTYVEKEYEQQPQMLVTDEALESEFIDSGDVGDKAIVEREEKEEREKALTSSDSEKENVTTEIQ